MTVENCIARYKSYVERGMIAAAKDMKQHILTAKKFEGHPFREELNKNGEVKAPEAPKEVKGAEKGRNDGKKSKR